MLKIGCYYDMQNKNAAECFILYVITSYIHNVLNRLNILQDCVQRFIVHVNTALICRTVRGKTTKQGHLIDYCSRLWGSCFIRYKKISYFFYS